MATFGGIPSTGSVSMTQVNNEFLGGRVLGSYRNNNPLWIQSSKTSTIKGFSGSMPIGFFRGKGLYAYYSINTGTYTFTTTYFGLAPDTWTKPFTATGYCSYGYDPATGVGSNFGSMNGNGNIVPAGYAFTTFGVRAFYRNAAINQIAILITGNGIPDLDLYVWGPWSIGLSATRAGFFDPGNGDLGRIYTLSNMFSLPTQFGLIWRL